MRKQNNSMGDLAVRQPGELVVLEPERADRHPAAVYLAGLSKSSRRPMAHALDMIAKLIAGDQADAWTINWPALRFQHTAAIRAALAERYAPATVNRQLSALRGVLKAAWRLGLMTAEEYHRAVDVDGITAEKLPSGRAITSGELAALMHVCAADPTPAGPRDAAMIGLMYSGGPRRAEVVGLDLEDYDAETWTVAIRSGKGRKDRLTYIEAGTADALADWLNVRGREPGPLFCPVLRSGRIVIRRLSDNAVYRMLEKRTEEAKIDSLTPHDLRRTFVSELLDAGVDLATVQKLAGHADPATTARYDRRDEATKREAVKRLHVPYRRRS
ncbi:MAG: tyrosine-type recombinase/integrase [Anaerolineae bacterium]